MQTKLSAKAILAGFLFAALLLYDILGTIATVTTYTSIAGAYLLWQVPFMLAELFVTIALFTGRRSWLPVAAFGIQTVMIAWQMGFRLLNGGKPFPLLCEEISVFLTCALVVFCCIPTLQNAAGWTGKVWFIPAILCKAATVINIFQNLNTYGKLLAGGPEIFVQLLMGTIIPIVAMLLFCLWLTEPVRHKKTVK